MRLTKLAIVFSLTYGCASVPSPVLVAQGPPVQVDSARLLNHMSVLADDSMQGRAPGTTGSERARRYILGEMRRLGLEPIGDSFEHSFRWRNINGVNLVGAIRGTEYPDRYIVVSAHYDHVGIGRPVRGDSIYNGADDNASGTSALLAVAEHFRRNPPAATLVFAALDAEEVGLRGAYAFVEHPPVPLGEIKLNVNLDMVSHSERGELYAVGTSHYPFLRQFMRPVADRSPIRLLFGHDGGMASGPNDWTAQSDQLAFHERGIPFVYFGVEDHDDYHTPSDEFDTITPGFFVGAVASIIDVVQTLDRSLPEFPARYR